MSERGLQPGREADRQRQLDKTVKVWDATSGQETLTLRGHTGPCHSVAFSPDGKRIATGSRDGTVKIWDASADPQRTQLCCVTGGFGGAFSSPKASDLLECGDLSPLFEGLKKAARRFSGDVPLRPPAPKTLESGDESPHSKGTHVSEDRTMYPPGPPTPRLASCLRHPAAAAGPLPSCWRPPGRRGPCWRPASPIRNRP